MSQAEQRFQQFTVGIQGQCQATGWGVYSGHLRSTPSYQSESACACLVPEAVYFPAGMGVSPLPRPVPTTRFRSCQIKSGLAPAPGWHGGQQLTGMEPGSEYPAACPMPGHAGRGGGEGQWLSGGGRQGTLEETWDCQGCHGKPPASASVGGGCGNDAGGTWDHTPGTLGNSEWSGIPIGGL